MQPRTGQASEELLGVSRRRFIRRSAGVAAGAGALVWSAPAMRTVQVHGASGSAPPTTSPQIAAAGAPTTDPTTTTTSPRPRVAARQGTLPFTGTDAARAAAIGATCVVAGGVMLRAQQATRHFPPN
jgi:hypothetical protein